jgi:DNA-binding XRE family transcriptional regulator
MPRERNQLLIDAFAQVLRAARANAAQTQEDLAFTAGIDRTFVGLLETGKRQPSLSVVFALAEALGTTPESLVRETRKLMA